VDRTEVGSRRIVGQHWAIHVTHVISFTHKPSQAIYEKAIETLPSVDEKIYIAYARFETYSKDCNRARAVYKHGLDHLARSHSNALHKAYSAFEKQFGTTEGLEDAVHVKRRVQYEEQIRANPKDYDTWIAYARLEEAISSHDPEIVRDIYEQAIAQLPPTQQKRHWRRYIYLWIYYALYEELQTKDVARARQVYAECLRMIPHSQFTSAKIWLLKARFDISQGDIAAARKTLGQAIGMCPKKKLFEGYINIELKMFEFTRCRILYEKYIEHCPANSMAWIGFAELERGLADIERVRAIYELALIEPLDMPELVWKAYIDCEEDEAAASGDYDRVRCLYERLVSRAHHVKVWIAYARFELSVPALDSSPVLNSKDADCYAASHLYCAPELYLFGRTKISQLTVRLGRGRLCCRHGAPSKQPMVLVEMSRRSRILCQARLQREDG
jgi:crooked neck